MPEHLASDRNEDIRRFLLAMVAHHATLVESLIDDAPASARIDNRSAPLLGELEGSWTWPAKRSRLGSGFRPYPIPESAAEWWRAHLGWVRVDCPMHGEVATVDTSRDPRMLGLLWDAALIECDFRWQDDWHHSPDEPEFEGGDCSPRIIPFEGKSEDDLLKVIEMWVRYEGPPLWWPYEMVPGFDVWTPEEIANQRAF
jgi:hypothetical protein